VANTGQGSELAARIISLQKTMRAKLQNAQEYQTKHYNMAHKATQYAIGDQVLLSTRHLRSPRPKRKLDYKFLGPFRVTEVIGKQAYRLELPKTLQIHPVFHVSLLEPYKGSTIAGRQQPPLMEIDLKEDDVYEVEAILGQKVDDQGRWTYKIRWKGYAEDEDSWEPATHISDAAMRAYKRKMAQNDPTNVEMPKHRLGRPPEQKRGNIHGNKKHRICE